ncbi:LysR family transcriptional regulator [Novosphingobium profundi]|uniref:LysR family transcriptional regulator n=1 Tax=Novosphingobium profundi TaxID=1774954 RepID=UPI001CFEAC6B|nr:LysR family transcriptional regulator [Novosphingobium profundi]
MRDYPFTLRQLEVFAILSETRSFRICAERLGISQASVSRQLSELEARMGLALFVRGPGRRPDLTTRGEAFLQDLDALDKAGRKLASYRLSRRERASTQTFRLRIGVGLFDPYVKPKLGAFLAAHPGIACEVQRTHPAEELAAPQRREASDFTVFYLRSDWPLPPHCRPLGQVRSGIYGVPEMAEAAALPLAAEACADLPLILPPQGSREEAMQLASLAEQGLVPQRVVARTEYPDVLVAMVERGVGAACLLEPLLTRSARAKLLRLFPLSDWTLVLYRNPGLCGERADALEAFVRSAILEDNAYPTAEET